MTSAEIPEGVSYIGEFAFAGCINPFTWAAGWNAECGATLVFLTEAGTSSEPNA